MSRRRFRTYASLVVAVAQLPAVTWLCLRAHSPLPAALAALLSLPYLRGLASPWAPAPRSAATYLPLAWWSACVAFDLLWGPAALATRAGAPGPLSYAAAWALALGVGADAVLGRPRLRSLTVRLPGLPQELEGYRIGHLSDVHCGPHTPAGRVARWVERLNRLDLDLAAVTGDLITQGEEHIEAVARALGRLHARDGAWACLGNHDYFTDAERFVRVLEGSGLPVLRNRGVVVQRGQARLYVAGVDDTWTGRDDLPRALAGRPAGAPAVLLAHDPDLFPQAAERGVELTLSGHTHGGQLGVPGSGRFSLARLVTPWAAGLYRRGRAWLYVSRGAGTTGPPVRLGAPPELAVITLRRA